MSQYIDLVLNCGVQLPAESLLNNVCAQSLSHVQLSVTPMNCSPPGSSVHGIFQTRHWSALPFLLQGIFPTQGSNPHLLCLLHWQADSLPLAPPGKPIKIVFEDFFCFLKKNTDTQTPLETILIFGGWSPETCFIKTPTWF